MMVFAVDTLEPFIAEKGKGFRILFGFTACYLAVVAVIFGAVKSGNWYRFNNKGYEMASGYPEFAEINRYLRTAYEKENPDPLNAPRVAYEKCDLYGSFGGDRVFESLLLFSGRQTLEGIHYAGSIAARFNAFIQTEFSRDIKTPKPQILSMINPGALPVHFDLYNISHLVVMTDTVKQALSGSDRFEREAQFGAASLYRYIGCKGRYVEVPDVRPVRYTGEKWVDDFFSWYKYPEGNDVLLVPDRYVTDRADRAVFFDSTDRVFDLGRFRSNRLDRKDLKIDSDIDHLRIRFTTNKPGIPHLVKVSYFPNWKVDGANGVYPVSPHLMMVIPRQKTVTLTYARSGWELAGLAVTCIGLFFILSAAFMRRLKKPKTEAENPAASRRWERLLSVVEKHAAAARPYILCLVIVSAAFLIAAGAAFRNRPVRTYIAGYHLYKEGNLQRDRKNLADADSAFRKAILTMKPLLDARSAYDHRDVINCILTTAMCHENLGEEDAAELWYLNLLSDYPYSRYVGEANVKLARIYRNRARNEFAPRDEQQNSVHVEQALGWMEKSLSRYRSAVEEDRFSVWAKYAVDDLKAERQRMDQWTKNISLLQTDEKFGNRMRSLTQRLEDLLNREKITNPKLQAPNSKQ